MWPCCSLTRVVRVLSVSRARHWVLCRVHSTGSPALLELTPSLCLKILCGQIQFILGREGTNEEMHKWFCNYTCDEDCKGSFSYLTYHVQGKFFYFQRLLSVVVSISGSTRSLVTKEVPRNVFTRLHVIAPSTCEVELVTPILQMRKQKLRVGQLMELLSGRSVVVIQIFLSPECSLYFLP